MPWAQCTGPLEVLPRPGDGLRRRADRMHRPRIVGWLDRAVARWMGALATGRVGMPAGLAHADVPSSTAAPRGQALRACPPYGKRSAKSAAPVLGERRVRLGAQALLQAVRDG